MFENSVVWFFAIVGFLASIITIVQFLRWWKYHHKITWDDALRVAENLMKQIQNSDWKPDFVLGIGRSGGIWGGWLAGNLGTLPFAVIDDKYSPNDGSLQIQFPAGEDIISAIKKSHPGIKNLLVVEGASAAGGTPGKFKELMKNELQNLNVRFAVLYKNPASTAFIEYIGKLGPEPWPDRFPWHFSNLYKPYLRDIFTPNKA